MNNGRFDLKRKLAFVAALAFTANSAYSVPAAGADRAAAVISVGPDTVEVPDEAVPPPPVQNGGEQNESVTYNIVINGISLDEDMFMHIAGKICPADISEHSFNADTGEGSIVVRGPHDINRGSIYNDAGDIRFELISETDGTFVYDTYYKVSGFGGDERISLKCRENDNYSELDNGFCKSGTALELIPSDCYIIDNGTDPLSIIVSAPVVISQDNFYNDGYMLVVDGNFHTVSPRTFSVHADKNVCL